MGPADFAAVDPDQATIGRLLFYDKVLSGNRNIACATCHNPAFGGSDGVSLGLGEGAVGPERHVVKPVKRRMTRNAPGLWNLGAREVRVLFHDGRLELQDGRMTSTLGAALPDGLDGLVAAQALFPLVSEFEMAGNPGENEIADATQIAPSPAWETIAERVRAIPEYAAMFTNSFDDVDAGQDITITHIANAIGAAVRQDWQSHDSPFDAFLAGTEPLSKAATTGMELFYGRAQCATCHAGPLFSDQQFHALGLPDFGPGRTRRFDPIPRDVGRLGVSDDPADAYRFRTPMLRNVGLTAPYGHNGAYPTLRGMLRHHTDPRTARAAWRPDMAKLPEVPGLTTDFILAQDSAEQARQVAAISVTPVVLSEADLDALIAFLHSLTGRSGPPPAPDSVPSGLSVD